MRETAAEGLFKPKPTRIEAKSDVTTRAARSIIDGEAAARIAKTKRLRAERLSQEELAPAAPVKAPRKTAVRKPKG